MVVMRSMWEISHDNIVTLVLNISIYTLIHKEAYCAILSQSNVLMCFQDIGDPRFFANYSLMVNLIEKLIREMNLDIYRVIEFIFST